MIEDLKGAVDRLIEQLRQNRGDLKLSARDFEGHTRGARFYPLLYMLTRVWKARDWQSDVELSSHLLGHLSRLELHHIFPKALLRTHHNGYSQAETNAIANFTFLTQETNLLVSNRNPAEYLEKFAEKNPGAIESHWIPMNRELWRLENYRDFLKERRELLAQAANEFLESLNAGEVPEQPEAAPVSDRGATIVPGGIAAAEEEELLIELNTWIVKQGLPEGEFLYELRDSESNEALAVLDLAWPDGLQEELSPPVALLVDEPAETEEAANRAGFRYFTDADEFRTYVKREILALDEETLKAAESRAPAR